MPFALDGNPSQTEISEAINYLLANFGSNLVADPNNGIIAGPSGVLLAYLYQYLAVKYADSYDGSVNFSNSPTNREYYGLRNTNSSVESTDYADYIWYKAAGGFGTTKFLFYQTSGGRQINFYIGTTSPDATYVQDSGVSIDLDIVTTSTAYNTAAPTIYQWTASSTPPARPSTTSTYTWSTGSFTPPSGWTSEPAINTTPGSYLWAITIPLVVSSGTVTSTLDWTSTSYAIYVAGSNGATGPSGTAGANGLAAITAYRVQNQATAAPSTPSNTTGPTAPSGWSLTAPSVTVGDVLWYTFGQYNSSSGTISGIPAGETQWGAPTAASVFQDIRSDNWNGSNPPVAGTPATYGTAGYYIQRSTGDMFLNSVYGRGVAQFDGYNNSGGTVSAIVANFSGNQTNGIYANAGSGGYGIYASGSAGVGAINANGFTNNGVAGATFGGSAYGGIFSNAGSGVSIYNFLGTIVTNNSTLVTNLNANYLQGYTASSFYITGNALGTPSSGNLANCTFPTLNQNTTGSADYLGGVIASSWARIFPCNSGTANAAGSGLNILGSASTGIAGAYVGTSGSGNTVTLDVRVTSPSDLRLKEEVAEIDVGLAFVKQLRPVSYKLKADPKHQKGYGFIAQEVENLIPNPSSLVYEEPDWKVGDEIGFKTIHYPSYIAVLTKAIQELSAEVEALKAKVA